ncbi:MAG: hypothetical protein IT209_00865 [Armatimonadetes bacterium]|nr:hypothetical protein [Armatimonadota bacterium]
MRALFCVTVLLLLGAPGFAQEATAPVDEAGARQHYLAGEKAFQAKDYAAAIEEWELTLKLKPSSEHTRKMLAKAKELRGSEKPPKAEATKAEPELIAIRQGLHGLVQIFKVDGKDVEVPMDATGSAMRVSDDDRIAYVQNLNDSDYLYPHECEALVAERMKNLPAARFGRGATFGGIGRTRYKALSSKSLQVTGEAWIENRFGGHATTNFRMVVHRDNWTRKWKVDSFSY